MTTLVRARQAIDRPGATPQALPKPYLVFLGDTKNPAFAKTAFGLKDWAGEDVVGEYALPEAEVTTGLAQMDPAAAKEAGARSLIIGVANSGGFIPDNWISALISALQSGLDLISGMHQRLTDIPELVETAQHLGRKLIDVRVPPQDIPVASGHRRTGRRILTVGTDCALGKKYAALSIARGLQNRGIDAQFRATGQTGIMIAGCGLPIDAIVADFVSGAAELLTPSADPDHVDVIEGQGSLFHPSYAPVSLGLLHGSQPDRFVVCHQADRTHILGNDDFVLPSIEQVIEMTISLGRLTNPDISCAGVALNTVTHNEESASSAMDRLAGELNLPVADPIRGGPRFEKLLDACLD